MSCFHVILQVEVGEDRLSHLSLWIYGDRKGRRREKERDRRGRRREEERDWRRRTREKERESKKQRNGERGEGHKSYRWIE